MIESKRSEGALLVVEGGASLAPLTASSGPVDDEQRRIKAELIATSFASDGLDAMALGATDWALGTSFVRGLVEAHSLPLLAANLTCGGQKPYPATRVVEQSGKRIGLVGVTAGVVDGCEVGDPRAAVLEAVGELKDVDVVLGLFPYTDDRDLAVLLQPDGAAGPVGVDLVIDARGRAVGAGAENRNGSWLIGSGSRTKFVALLDLTFVAGAEEWATVGGEERAKLKLTQLEDRRAALDGRAANATDPELLRRVEAQKASYDRQIAEAKALIAAEADQGLRHRFVVRELQLSSDIADAAATEARLKVAKDKLTQVTGQDPAVFVPRTVADTSSPYAGGEVCAGCHAPEHAQWSQTAHARAWSSLVAEQRALDGECWGCHVTGSELPGGPQSPLETAGFRDVQCEACHGAGRAHASDPTTPTPAGDVTVNLCTRCHDGMQDQGRFDPDTYLPKVVHGPATLATPAAAQ